MAEDGRRQLILLRLIGFQRNINLEIDRVGAAKLRTYEAENVTQLLLSALEYMRVFLEAFILEIGKGRVTTLSAEQLSDTFRITLDNLTYLIHSMINDEAPSVIYDFLDLFRRNYRMPHHSIVVIRGVKLCCYCLNDSIQESGINLNGDFYRVWVIECPTRIEIDPFEWPIILHELGHIIERESLNVLVNMKLITNHYELHIRSSENVQDLHLHHILEYVCDMIACRLIGPVFLFRIMDSYLIRAFTLSRTHPEWTSRLNFLLNAVPYSHKMAISPDADPLFTQAKEEGEKPSIINPPPNLNEVINYLDSLTFIAQLSKDSIDKCKDRIKQFKPYTEDISTLMNASYIILRNRLFSQDVIQLFQDNEYKLSSEFSYLIADCIRLTRIRYCAADRLS